MKYLILFFTLFISPLVFSFTDNLKTDGWEKVETSDDFIRYERTLASPKRREYAFTATVEDSAERILSVMLNARQHKNLLKVIKKSETLEKTSELDFIQYTAFDLPFPIQDRELIFHLKIDVEKKERTVNVELVSVDFENRKVAKGYTRAEMVVGSFQIREIGEGKTEVKAKYLLDLKGSIPESVSKEIHRRWPKDTMKSLKKQLKDPELKIIKIF